MTAKTALVGFEWAGRRVQAWAFDRDGEIVSEFEVECSYEAGKLSSARVIRDMIINGIGSPADVPMIGCGDLATPGLKTGVPALTTPVAVAAIAESLHAFDALHIVPWLLQMSPPDLTCGSETLLAALEAPHGPICCITDQVRHFNLQDGRVASFATQLVPDLYRHLSKAEILKGARIGGSVAVKSDIFTEWVDRALDKDGAASVFRVYAALLSGHLAEADGASALLGLLVGSDIAAHYDPGDEVMLMADGLWLEAYMQAFKVLGAEVEAFSAHEALKDGLFELADMAGLVALD
jgi:2-dehydro-3-deoxygalactonokinase